MILLSLSMTSCGVVDILIDEAVDYITAEDSIQEEGIQEESGKEKGLEAEVVSDIEEDGYYTNKEDVSLYLSTYHKLPHNFISKKEAADLGWESSQGNLWDVTDKMSIGGDRFGNREKRLPAKEGRTYQECDLNYQGKYRGAERLVYSNDGLIYYTGDHYETFTLLYGEES